MRSLIASVLIWMAAALALAAEPLAKLGVVLLQPSDVLEQRVPTVDAMADYIKAVEAAAREAVRSAAVRQATSGFIVIAVKPGAKSKVWLDFDTLVDPETSRQLVARITAVEPFEARNGPVVFAVKVSMWDGRESRRIAPSPTEWKAATRQAGRQLDIDSLIQRVWREPDA
ncbi:MAG TPA: hypothetical protein VML58_14660 [Burkholderiaceae bacterium]|nr:hypothetical protein [Burkholderiaceae bacterium]